MPVHPLVTDTDIDFVGLSFDGNRRTLRVSRKKAWQLHLALKEFCRRRRCRGSVLEQILVHYAWVALVCRPALCVFGATYRWMREHKRVVADLPRSVLVELRTAAALVPLLVCHLSAKWNSRVYCSDSSNAGFAVIR